MSPEDVVKEATKAVPVGRLEIFSFTEEVAMRLKEAAKIASTTSPNLSVMNGSMIKAKKNTGDALSMREANDFMYSADSNNGNGKDRNFFEERPEGTLLCDLIYNRRWDEVHARLKSHPEEALEPIARPKPYGESLALHEACRRQPPAEVINILIDAYKPAVSIPGEKAYLPLHIAVKCDSADAVFMLIKAQPDCVRKKDESGKLPIHLACECGASPKVIQKLLIEYPQSFYLRDNEEKSPIDCVKTLLNSNSKKFTEIIGVMKLGPMFCAVSKATLDRMKGDFEEVMKIQADIRNEQTRKLVKINVSERLMHTKKEEILSQQVNIMQETDEKSRIEIKMLKKELGEKLKETNERASAILKAQEAIELLVYNVDSATCQNAVLLSKMYSMAGKNKKALKEKQKEVTSLMQNTKNLLAQKNDLKQQVKDAERVNVEYSCEINELKKTVLALSASIGALTVPYASLQGEESISEMTVSAISLVNKDDTDQAAQTIMSQKKKLSSATYDLEKIIRKANLCPTPGISQESHCISNKEDSHISLALNCIPVT